jgi:hypothetical protein
MGLELKSFMSARALAAAGLVFTLAAVGAMATGIFNDGTADGVNAIVTEIGKQYPEAPYTAATLPANVTDSFANSLAIPAAWGAQGDCAAGSRQSPSGGCWSIIIQTNGIHAVFPGYSRDQCLTLTSQVRPDVHRRITFVGIAPDNSATLTNSVAISSIAAELRRAAVQDFGKTNCLPTATNQLAFVIR